MWPELFVFPASFSSHFQGVESYALIEHDLYLDPSIAHIEKAWEDDSLHKSVCAV